MKRVLKDTLPAFMAYFPIGILFGYIFVKMGFEWYLAPIMSAMVYAGAVQFLCLSILVQGGTLLDMAIGGILLSLRNFFYGFAFLDRKGRSLISHLYIMFGLVDATYSILLADKSNDKKYRTRVNFIIHMYWILGSLLGAVVQLPNLPYVDFALTTLFVCIALDQWQFKPSIVAVISAIIASFILPTQMFPIAVLISIGLLIAFPTSKLKVST